MWIIEEFIIVRPGRSPKTPSDDEFQILLGFMAMGAIAVAALFLFLKVKGCV